MKKRFGKTKDYKYILSGRNAEITEYLGSETVVNIPETLNNSIVAAIGERAFYNNESVTKVFIPASVSALRKEAFSCCKNLIKINIDNGLSTISSFCFSNCSALDAIILPKSVTTIYRGAFRNCVALKEIEIPEGITVLSAELFYGCERLEQVGLPYGLERIYSGAFQNCSKLHTFYHYGKRNINSIMVIDKNLKEYEFPTRITHIGNSAFEDCISLSQARIPHRVSIIGEGTFKNCKALTTVYTHNLLREIKNEAFYGCENLKVIKLPVFTRKIGRNAFNSLTCIHCEKAAFAATYASRNYLSCRYIEESAPSLFSHMIPAQSKRAKLNNHPLFYTEQDLRECQEKFEMRPPSYKKSEKSFRTAEAIESSRFDYANGMYTNKNRSQKSRAVIMMAGGLLCGARHQETSFDSGKYFFDTNFLLIKDLLKQSDFAIATLESMVSPSAPLTAEVEYVNTAKHHNAPESYLGAIRKASFDAVINAQNHAYDTGVQGIFETLDMQNRYQLMHTGVFASTEDKRYLFLEINGIRIACLSYLDSAKGRLKKVNFSRIGRETLLNYLNSDEAEKTQIGQDVANAKAEGAEFIIAFCHWGKEYSQQLTERQLLFSQQVADAGVDYIFGSHSHCVQPYDVITASDGRRVPVYYSAGSLISDISVRLPITRDALIGELILKRDEDGQVTIEREGYYPCRVVNLEEDEINYMVVPTAMQFEERTLRNKRLADAEGRIKRAVGTKINERIPQEIPLLISELAIHKTPESEFDIAEVAKLLDVEFIKNNANTKLSNLTYRINSIDEHSVFVGLRIKEQELDSTSS